MKLKKKKKKKKERNEKSLIQKFFFKILLKVREHENIYIFEIKFEKS